MNRFHLSQAAILFLLLAGGCRTLEVNPIVKDPVSVSPRPPAVVQQDTANLQNRFSDETAEQQDAVQSAVMWSEKYQQLSETASELREKNIRLLEENTMLKQEVQTIRVELTQTRKELDDANSFLQKMHLELTQWKTDVLGFRDEIRRSEAAQLSALAKILRILGAEPVEPAAAPPAGQ